MDSNKSTIIISKMGSICYTSDYSEQHRNRKQQVKGDQGATIAVIQHLLTLDLNVIYFGRFYGELPEGLHYVQSHIEGLNCWSESSEQLRGFEKDIQELNELLDGAKPIAFVAISGYASNMSVINNEWQITCQAAAIRYNAPNINVMKRYKLPRVTICNDTRNYPNEGEVATEGWGSLRSVALLSQREKEWIKNIQYERWHVSEKYAAAEHWRLFDNRQYPEKTVDCQVVNHAHIKCGKKLGATYDEVWRQILNSDWPNDFKIYGLGWEHYSGYDPKIMPGITDSKEVFARSRCTVVTTTGGGLYTNKIRFALSQNCLPLFYGRDPNCEFTVDPLGKYIPLNDLMRISEPNDLMRTIDWCCTHEAGRQNEIDRLWKLTSPDYSMLDNCISDIVAGRDMTTDNWREDYGGYYRTRKKLLNS